MINDNIKFLILIYLSLSILEWFVHKYIMHARPGELLYFQYLAESHHAHHVELNVDGTMQSTENVTGLIFGWDSVIILSTLTYIVLYSINVLLKFDYTWKQIGFVIVFISIFYTIFWNTFHQKFHLFHIEYPLSTSLPASKFLSQLDNYQSFN